MNKTNKRYMNLRNKLFAAIAMLLVSSIMMVSSTYAWFTLSTAPEVQGITTTVGANGNLEIALSPTSGNAADLGKDADGNPLEVGMANQNWAVKNHSWGNLLSMTDDIYGLSEIALLPSRLNITAGANGANATLNENPLQIPVYGADGRISALDATKVVIGGRVDGSFDAGSTNFGVRAVGTSSSMSQTALNFQSALSAINSNRLTANGLAVEAINTYGPALAGIAIKHANADDTGYEEYSDTLNGMVDKLVEASDTIEQSLFNALLALASTEAGASKVSYDDVKAAMTAGTPLKNLWPADTGVALLNTAYAQWNAANTNISTAAKKLSDLEEEKPSWSWADVSGALVTLVDISNEEAVTMNGFKISELESHITEILAAGGLYLQMNNGSGVFDNIAKLTGKITGQVNVPQGLTVKGISVGGVPVNIVSTGTPAEGAYLVQLRAVIGGMPVAGDTGANVQPIDVTYGYGIDFMFRTNVANSSLLLQTEAAQRVYSDSTNADTQGHGSTMSFTGTNIDSLLSMMDGIRIVFANTADNGVYGIAKLDQTSFKISYQVTTQGEGEGTTATTETKTGTLTIAADGTKTYEGVTAPEAGTEVTLTGFVRMYNYTIGNSGLVFSTSTKDTICTMPQNGVVRVTAWVFLDGDAIDNTDVTNSETGISTTGTLNLQFASSAALVPMENTDLFNGPSTPANP